MNLCHGLLDISEPAFEFVNRRAVHLVLRDISSVGGVNLGRIVDVGGGHDVLGRRRSVGGRRCRIDGLFGRGNVFGFHGAAEPIGGPPGSQRRVGAHSDRPHTSPIVTLMEVRPILLLLGLMLLGCASDVADTGPADQETTSSTVAAASSTTTVPVTVPSTATSSSTTVATSTTLPATTTTIAEPTCVTLMDFSESNEAWRAVNDGVMGGRSEGGPSFADGSMMFAGEINTNGGGFSSVRALLAPGTLAGTTAIRVVGVPDDRTYRLILSDAADGRDRRVSHQADLVFESTDETSGEVATVSLDSLETSVFGQLVFTEPFEPDLAAEIGIQIADGIDGPFMLTVSRIERCGPG